MDASDIEIVQLYQEVFTAHADPDRAEGMKAYMRDQFEFLGLSSPVRKQCQKEILATGPSIEDPFAVAAALWQLDAREYQNAACDLLRGVFTKKKLPYTTGRDALLNLRGLILSKSWWDTIDALAPVVMYNIVSRYDDVDLADTCREWIRDDSFWIQRSALLCQLKAKEATDESLLFELVLHIAREQEFFLRKGAGWALREHSKKNPESTRAFIESNRDALSPLTIREGGKYC